MADKARDFAQKQDSMHFRKRSPVLMLGPSENTLVYSIESSRQVLQ